MAVLSMQFYAKTLGMHTTITAILPSETSALEPDDTGFYHCRLSSAWDFTRYSIPISLPI